VDERSEARYLTILAGVLLLVGVGLGWSTHLAWLSRFDSARQVTGIQSAWHGLRALLPFALLAAALWVLPRRRPVAATLCISAAFVAASSAFVLRSTLRSAGRDGLGLSFGPAPETMQCWLAALGALVAATISRWQNVHVRRP
jgi:hypothetical protein